MEGTNPYSVNPLSDRDRATVKQGFRDYDPVSFESRTTHVLYSTGMHPAVVGDPARWRVQVVDGIIGWERTKTRRSVAVPIDPDIAGWIEEFFGEMRSNPAHPVTVNQRVHAFGEMIGLPLLTPRGLRHDFANRAVNSRGIVDARELTGTSTDVLMVYARRKLAREVARDPRGLF